jgi:hypothetical protein
MAAEESSLEAGKSFMELMPTWQRPSDAAKAPKNGIV